MSCLSTGTNSNLCYSETRGLKTSTCTSSGCYSCKKLDGVGAWLCHGVAAFYFASLDWFSCIYLQTIDDDPNVLPLLPKSDIQMSDASTEIPKQGSTEKLVTP
ncbi:hypothetical protein L6164_027942 [Bauhinia variegata]|uniref:Uncharacterized protein n=1 Tax=Bauhinia variegata TaxID=167791 RepID=A0ACB9LUY5_BAUVA|nr:hypothetical protein L6164_027942 [Bauhinia variegata]